MKNISKTLLLLIFCTVQSWQACAQTPKYTFPEKTVITHIEFSCLEFSDLPVIALSQGDKVLLDMMSDSIIDSVEIRFGASALEEIRKRMVFIEDERTQRLRNILQKMLPYVSRTSIDYKVFLVEDSNQKDISNAWTHSGGQIYFTVSMLKSTQSDDEIAFIMGHEIGHNENRHCAVHFRRMAITNGIWKFFTKEDNASISQLGSQLYEIIFTAFTQKQELESDKAGAYLANAAGYNPKSALDFFTRLAKEEKKEVLSNFVRSHPYSNTRKKCLEKYIDNSKSEK